MNERQNRTHVLVATLLSLFVQNASSAANSRSALAQSTGCSIALGGTNRLYSNCVSVAGPLNINMYWTMLPTEENADIVSVDFAFEGKTPGWSSIAFPSIPAEMIGASAVIAQLDPTALAGARADSFYLGSYERKDVTPPSLIPISNITAEVLPGLAGVKSSFQAQLSSTFAKSTRSSILLAWGRTGRNGEIMEHNEFGSIDVDLTLQEQANSGDKSVENVTVGPTLSATGVAHAWLMTLGFGVAMPLAVLGAVGMRAGLGYAWFEAHRIIMIGAFAMVIAGLATGIVEAGGLGTSFTTHRDLGIAAVALVFFQIIIGFVRPRREHKKLRSPWNLIHHNIGRVALILGIANIYDGMLVVYPSPIWAYATFSAVLGVLVVLFVVLTLYKYKRLHATSVNNSQFVFSRRMRKSQSTKSIADQEAT